MYILYIRTSNHGRYSLSVHKPIELDAAPVNHDLVRELVRFPHFLIFRQPEKNHVGVDVVQVVRYDLMHPDAYLTRSVSAAALCFLLVAEFLIGEGVGGLGVEEGLQGLEFRARASDGVVPVVGAGAGVVGTCCRVDSTAVVVDGEPIVRIYECFRYTTCFDTEAYRCRE